MLHVKEPYSRDRGHQRRRQEHEQQNVGPAQPADHSERSRDRGVGRQRAVPIAPARPHLADRQPVLQEEQVERYNAKQEKRIADQAVHGPAGPVLLPVFPDRQGGQVAGAALVEIAGGGMMHRMVLAPDIIGRQRQDTQQPADPVAQPAVLEERAVAAIVLDHEQAHQKGRIRQCQRHRQPGADRQRPPGQRPDRHEWHQCNGQFE